MVLRLSPTPPHHSPTLLHTAVLLYSRGVL
nr:MAG TPA: hypothetical protein [Caudoviricetes sp.]